MAATHAVKAKSAQRRGGPAKHFHHVISDALAPSAKRRGFTLARLIVDWPLIVGPAWAEGCRPVKFGGGRNGHTVLHLQANAAAALELTHCVDQVIERVNTYLGARQIVRLQVVQAAPHGWGRPARSAAVPAPQAVEPAVPLPPIAVEDEALHAALARLQRSISGTKRR